MRETKHLFAVAAAAVIVAFTGTVSRAADVFTLKSTMFEEGKIMPKGDLHCDLAVAGPPSLPVAELSRFK